jgi:benzoyl-CoA-dihydrodiol lyase
MNAVAAAASAEKDHVTFDVEPARYKHWKLSFDGEVATLAMDVEENGGLRPGYRLKLNSYDLGVDIELHDAIQRIRFEHPEIRAVVLTSAKERIFCSGANIFMLGLSSHAWKVNFCKFTNETRNGIEDASRHSGLKFIAACNGTTAGGGYELALACDEIVLTDDHSAAVSLPEVPLLAVLPGTGGLTRLTDKRRVRRDHADMFCTVVEGVRAPRAKQWNLIDSSAKPQQFVAHVRNRCVELAALSDRPADSGGVPLTPLERVISTEGYQYSCVDVQLDRPSRLATVTIQAPEGHQPASLEAILAAGARWWPLKMARELDDAILMLHTNELDIGTWVLKTRGRLQDVLAMDQGLASHAGHWFVREVRGMLRRTLARLEVSSRSIFALVDSGSCFAGTLLELALAADRIYMLSDPQADDEPRIALSAVNFGAYPTVAQVSRLYGRFYGDDGALAGLQQRLEEALPTQIACDLGVGHRDARFVGLGR